MTVLLDVLLFLHLLGFAALIGLFLLQRGTAPGGPLLAAWLPVAGVQLLTGLGLFVVDQARGTAPDPVKYGVKLVVLLVILGGVAAHRRRAAIPSLLAPALAGLVLVNVGIAVWAGSS